MSLQPAFITVMPMLSVITLTGLLMALAALHTLEMQRHALENHHVMWFKTLKWRPKQKHPIHTMLFFSKLVRHKSRSAKIRDFFSLFPDVNECTNNVDNCDANAFCKNTGGSYNCTCSPGYTGNGTSCTGIIIQLLSEKAHVTISKGIVGSFEFAVPQWNLKEWHERPWTYVCEC